MNIRTKELNYCVKLGVYYITSQYLDSMDRYGVVHEMGVGLSIHERDAVGMSKEGAVMLANLLNGEWHFTKYGDKEWIVDEPNNHL